MLIADTHVHVYPSYDAAAALEYAYRKLISFGRQDAACHAGLLLVERYDCFFYRNLISGETAPPVGFSIKPTAETGAIVLENVARNIRIILFAGRQIVTADGIEVLALTVDADIADRQPTATTLALIREAGAIPVLSWAPGKWMDRRGKIIRDIIEQHGKESLALGDTSLRPIGWPTPGLMKRARKKHIPILAGSDPLPIAGEENIMGSYAIRTEQFDADHPVSSIRAILQRGQFSIVGRRNVFPVMMQRWLHNQRIRKL